MSPQLDPTKAEYVEEARPGMFLNTVTGEVSKELRVIPCAYKFVVNERQTREQGGRFIARHERGQEPKRDEYNHTAKGTELIDTSYHYVLALNDEGFPEPAVMIFRSTQLAKSKKWNAKMSALKMRHGDKVFTPPMYSSIYTVVSGKESNEKGNWFGYVIEREGYVEDPSLLAAAKAFHETALSKKLSEEAPEEKRNDAADEVM